MPAPAFRLGQAVFVYSISNIQTADNFLQAFRTLVKQSNLAVGQRHDYLAFRTFAADDVQYAETYVIDAVLTVHHGGDGHGGVNGAQQCLADMAHGNGYGVEGSTLAGDNARTGLANVVLDLIVVQGRNHTVVVGQVVGVIVHGNVGDVGDGPRNESGVTVLTHDVGVHVLLVDLVVFGQSCTQTGGVQNGTGTDDLLLRQTGALAEGIGKNVNRVADDYVLRVGGIAGDLRDNALGDVYVDLGQIQTGLTGFTCYTGGENDDVGIYRIAMVA